METTMFQCGCSITRSMFGEHELIDVHFCQKHLQDNPKLLDCLASEMDRIQNEDKETNHEGR